MKCMFLCAVALLVPLQALAADPDFHPALKYGAPDTGRIMVHDRYVLSYDGRIRSARWVAERLTKQSLVKVVDREDEYRSDPLFNPEFRAELSDYQGSGFDRGHLAPSANHRLSRIDNSETFYLSNMSPQVGIGFNRHYWARLEESIRNLALQDGVREVYVFTGPLFMPENAPDQGEAVPETVTVEYRLIGGNHIPVPTHYFKAVLAVFDRHPRQRMWAYVLPNEAIDSDTSIEEFAVTIDYLEHWAGIDLWPRIADDREDSMEETEREPWAPLPPPFRDAQ